MLMTAIVQLIMLMTAIVQLIMLMTAIVQLIMLMTAIVQLINNVDDSNSSAGYVDGVKWSLIKFLF